MERWEAIICKQCNRLLAVKKGVTWSQYLDLDRGRERVTQLFHLHWNRTGHPSYTGHTAEQLWEEIEI